MWTILVLIAIRSQRDLTERRIGEVAAMQAKQAALLIVHENFESCTYIQHRMSGTSNNYAPWEKNLFVILRAPIEALIRC